MKKETPRVILLLFIIASVMIFAVSCKQNREESGDTLPDTERTAQTLLENWQNYTIIRSDTSSTEIKTVASELLRTVQSKTGKTLDISTDLATKNELEIRIGKTNRTPDDAQALKTLDFSVSFEEKAVIIRGGTDEATANAMRWFCDNCVTENGILSFKDYKYKAEYALENVNIGGIPLSDFTVSCDKRYETEQTALTSWITEQTGILPSFKESSGTIRLESSASLGYRDIKVCLEGNTVTLTVHDFGASMSEAVDFFKEIIADRLSDNIDKLDERKKSVGGTNMLSNTFYMLSEEGRLNVAYLGGSITYGQGATEYKNNWVSNTTAWFAKHFPEAEITENNAGICDTCSDYGLFRLEQDVFESGTPDLIFIEYTSNDGGEKEKISIQTESIIRKIYEKNPYCDIVFIYTKPMTEYEGLSVYEADHELSEHYGLMEIGAGQLLCRTMLRDYPSEDGKYGASPLSADRVHPTDEGYALYMSLISEYLDTCLASYKPENRQKADLPKALNETLMLSPVMIDADELDESDGWERMSGKIGRGYKTPAYDHWLEASKEGASLTFTFRGTALGLLIYRSSDVADIEYSIDGGEFKVCKVPKGYGNCKVSMLEYSLEDTAHTVTLRVRASDYGSLMRIVKICISGTF